LAQKGSSILTCVDVDPVIGALTQLTLKPLDSEPRQEVYREVARRFRADPAETGAWLAGMSSEETWGYGVEAVERYTTDLHQALSGTGRFGSTEEPLGSVLAGEVVVRSRDDQEGLVLTESSIEGWIHYASLCREVQGAGGLRVSISDRVRLYRDLGERFELGTRSEKLALAAMGPFWRQVEMGWRGASYHEQQAWIAEAPLPPPMVATSLGYAQQVFEGDVVRHIEMLNAHFGPLGVVSMAPTKEAEVD